MCTRRYTYKHSTGDLVMEPVSLNLLGETKNTLFSLRLISHRLIGIFFRGRVWSNHVLILWNSTTPEIMLLKY